MIENEALKVVSNVGYCVRYGLDMLDDWELEDTEKVKLLELLDQIDDAAAVFYSHCNELSDALDDAASKAR